ncbi:hypothetical protein HanRHA438_Chr04g0150081 [Helianthus annuus]|uniref:Uncharacterized protein n=1 Tax=Helianthus annuus TaxID=4232 RepID=A0A251UVK8_HELAN|nr:hypothetical protein HanXRQr2_Chr04g0138641 [Helianthus annuus]KAJ0595043.1 hypothetical protein HanHA89_Chr04g0127021 [Helianthus annuus]KAJ0759515.1 hypothetical protein HanOQP8_Chr04g0127591 [Helianthus annuus]KAJ0924575.1 hypothetical protein HanRHA438_Chr04g0150081 [Helianthus annuus]KAJ0929214.1 hypothetical protein HanPSC8_Chr04g0135201 [Helianthus annuus]
MVKPGQPTVKQSAGLSVKPRFGSLQFRPGQLSQTEVKLSQLTDRVTSVFRPPISSTRHTWIIGRNCNIVDEDDAKKRSSVDA